MFIDIVASSFTVGYAQSGLKFGATMTTPQFISVNGSTMDLQALIPTGEGVSDCVVIQTLDAYGRTVDSYNWNDWACDEPCWVNDDYEKIEGVSFAPGTGLWVQGDNTEQGVQSAGKVGLEDVDIALRYGATGLGNPFPVDVDLQDIIPLGEGVSDCVVIQTLDAYGRTADSYNWNDWACDEPCWVNDDYEKIEGVSFTPGQGLWVQGDNAEQSIRFPAPEL